MIGLNRLQVLGKQNKDYRICLENREGKAQLALARSENDREKIYIW
jgi:hypothetical protein